MEKTSMSKPTDSNKYFVIPESCHTNPTQGLCMAYKIIIGENCINCTFGKLDEKSTLRLIDIFSKENQQTGKC